MYYKNILYINVLKQLMSSFYFNSTNIRFSRVLHLECPLKGTFLIVCNTINKYVVLRVLFLTLGVGHPQLKG